MSRSTGANAPKTTDSTVPTSSTVPTDSTLPAESATPTTTTTVAESTVPTSSTLPDARIAESVVDGVPVISAPGLDLVCALEPDQIDRCPDGTYPISCHELEEHGLPPDTPCLPGGLPASGEPAATTVAVLASDLPATGPSDTAVVALTGSVALLIGMALRVMARGRRDVVR